VVWHPERQLPPAAEALRVFLLDHLRARTTLGDATNAAGEESTEQGLA
jgi:hypothetical protein